jgi:hypothetical protein
VDDRTISQQWACQRFFIKRSIKVKGNCYITLFIQFLVPTSAREIIGEDSYSHINEKIPKKCFHKFRIV